MAITPKPSYTTTKQEFLNSVVDKLARQELHNKVYTSPLQRLVGEVVSGPADIEEIYIEDAESITYDVDGKTVLDRVKPTVAVQYHRDTVEHAYKCTIQNKQMRKGFLTPGAMGSVADGIINSIHNAKALDDESDIISTLNALKSQPKGTKVNVIETPTPTDMITATDLNKAIKKTIGKMRKRNTKYSDKKQHALPEDLILMIDSDADVEMQVELYANLFNADKAEIFSKYVMIIPELLEDTGCNAILLHEKCLKLNPMYYDIDSIKNTQGKFINWDLVTEMLTSYSSWYPHAFFVPPVTK